MESIYIHQSRSMTYDFEDVMEIDKEWYDEYVAKNPGATPKQIWDAAYEDGFEYETESSEANYDDEIHDTWIGE